MLTDIFPLKTFVKMKNDRAYIGYFICIEIENAHFYPLILILFLMFSLNLEIGHLAFGQYKTAEFIL